ncbi:TonB-dependent hemoglobin/transferrin/lactoferrin family receptor [Vibrio sp. SCSIO 43137]|uniref:TonB-dependent hemoglobin/transferrin/lactoferrin family receptor n=1 Tax=Vibrio sp. SCSIO 43137 TaxID=3021011 RepID=UPI0023071F5B|nr:TonB-dependent hemoglobin/transferrin/lactoferrin family receptor [Vibrio sp. SCSIO 43137]WCE30621.1 TonB-dependent hemoglobin/transferrin/lactoferrin family receptor [Vibrio sp. SCSIO 43137]
MFNKTPLAMVIGALVAAPAVVNAENYTFDEVVVSATRTELAKQDAPSSIETVSAEQMEQTMAGDIKQALKFTPGVDVKGSGRFGISGFNIRGVEDSRIKMMIDGVQQPVPYSAGRTEQRSYPNSIEIDTLQSIEVNKGPSSTLFGSDALGGVVLLRTKNPEDILLTDGDEHRFGIKSGYSSEDEQFKNTLTWAMRKDKLETLVMATYAKGHETETHGSGSTVSGPDRGAANPADKELGNLLAKAFYQINDDHRVGFTTEFYNKQYDENEINYEGYSAGPGFVYTDSSNKDTNKRLRVGFEHEMTMQTLMADSLKWSVNYQDSSTLNKNFDNTPANGKRLRQREAINKSVQLESQLSKLVQIGDNSHEFTYGASYRNNDFELKNKDIKFDTNTVSPGSSLIPDAKVTQWGVFTQDQVYLMEDRWVVTAGLRYDSFRANPSADEAYTANYKANNDSALTGRLGSAYHLNDNFTLFGQISQGFKAPTINDLYYSYNSFAIIEANPDLKAERSLAYELGLRGQNDIGNFEITTFYNDYEDFIAQVTTGTRMGRTVYTNKNLDEVKIYGAEFSGQLDLENTVDAPQGSYARIAVTYVDGEDKKSGKSLDSTAPLTTVVGLGLDRDAFGGLMNVKMVKGKDEWQTDNNVKAPGYTLVDLTAYYKPIKDLKLSAGLFNVFDKKYWLYDDIAGRTSSTFHIDGKSQPGRNWAVTLDYQF